MGQAPGGPETDRANPHFDLALHVASKGARFIPVIPTAATIPSAMTLKYGKGTPSSMNCRTSRAMVRHQPSHGISEDTSMQSNGTDNAVHTAILRLYTLVAPVVVEPALATVAHAAPTQNNKFDNNSGITTYRMCRR